MRDPYEVLGVAKAATQGEIQQAYRDLAKKLHPDLNPGDETAEARFKEVTAAYGLLSDPEKRAQFDRGEIDASGAERPHRDFYRDFAETGSGEKYYTQEGFANPEDLQAFMEGLFGGQGRAGSSHFRTKGGDVNYTLPVAFLDAANGAQQSVTMPDGRSLKINIPSGVRDKQMLRLKGQGMPGYDGGAPGDAFVEIHIQPHPLFNRKDNNIHIELPVSLNEAILGARIAVPTIQGAVTMTIPKGANTGTTLRLKGKGIPSKGGAGHQYVTLKVVLPEEPDAALADFIAGWAEDHAYNPRSAMEREVRS